MSAASATFIDISAREWSWVEGLIRDVEEQNRRDHFLGTVFQWEMAERQFRKMELEWDALAENPPSATAVQHHATCLKRLINIGEHLCEEFRRHDAAELATHGVNIELLDAILWGLQHSWEAWHVPSDPAVIADLKRRIFHAPA